MTGITTHCVGKRCLLRVHDRGFGNEINEYLVLEMSPSGEWVKLMIKGYTFWHQTKKIEFIEELRGDNFMG